MRGMENFVQDVSSQDSERKKFKVAIVDNSDQVESAARDVADGKLTSSTEDIKGLKGLLRRIWKHNLAKPFYRQRETALAKKRILESGNVFVDEDGENGQAHHEREKQATLERFLSEYDETIHKSAGENRAALGKNESEQAIQSKVKNLIMDYAAGKISDEVFPEEKNRILNELKGERGDVIGKGLMYADNMLEIAKQIKQSAEHGERIEQLDFDFEVVIGKAKAGVRTEAQYDAIDKLTAKIMDSKIGSLVNETTVASAVSIAYSLGTAASRSFANSKLAAWGTFGMTAVLGGGVAAMRERKMLEDDRKQHFREMAQGKKFEDSKSPRRKEMSQYRYETRDADSLLTTLNQSLYSHDKEGKQEFKKELSSNDLQVAFGQLAEIESRIILSDEKRIDLISFSDVKNVEQERLELDIARAKAKVELRKHADSEAMKNVLGGEGVDEFLLSLTEARMIQLMHEDGGVDNKNKLFNDCKTKATAKAFVKGVATGLIVGAAAQELMAFMNSNQTGLLENIFSSDAHAAAVSKGIVLPQHFTPLEYARRWMTDNFTGEEFPRMDMRNAHEVVIGAAHVRLPEGVNLVQNSHGGFNLLRGSEMLDGNVTFDAHGNITQEARNFLQSQGIEIKSTIGQGTPDEFIKHGPGSTKSVHRSLWYDNDTPKPVFDKNELKCWWGGNNGAGIDSDGNYVFNVKHMTPDGSYHGKFSGDAKELMQNGKLKMLFSLSRDTQNHVFEVSVDANGNAVIDPNSEAGKILFANVDGHAKFLGKYAEVAQIMGDGNDGAEQVRILATHVGKGIEQVATPILTFGVPAPYEVDAPWVFPVLPRIPLEKTTEIYPYLDGYFKDDKRNAHFYKERQSSSLENPNVKLNPVEEIGGYLKRQEAQWKQKLIEMNEQINAPMDEACRMVVCIPAAGHQEGKNIFNTLSQYKSQKNANGELLDPGTLELLIFVNHPKDNEPDETLAEIKRFEKENPEINVRVAYEKLDRKDAKIGNIRKYVTDLALLRHSQRVNHVDEIIIASNDADCKGMSEFYVSNFLDKFEEYGNVDAMLGKIDWENEAYLKSPLLHMGTRFFQYLDAVYRNNENKFERSVGSSGANFVFKGSIYAAVGGYIEDDTIAEDRHLGTMIKNARRGAVVYPVEYGGAKSYIYTSARRAVAALKRGLSPAEQWGTDFGPDDELRKMDWDIDDSEKDLDSREYQEKLKVGLQRFINRTIKLYVLEPESWVTQKAMRFMGVRYTIVKKEGINEIVLTDISKLIKGLKEYKK